MGKGGLKPAPLGWRRWTPPLPKAALEFGAGWQARRVARRLQREGATGGAQWPVLTRLVRRMSTTELGRRDGMRERMSYAEFRARVPLRAYEQFAPFIARMMRGQEDVLWPGICAHYAVSSGTTAGRTKHLPITAGMIAHFQQTGLYSLLFYAARVGYARVFRGRHLFLGGSTALAPIAHAAPFPAWAGDLSGILALNLPGWVERHLYEPGADIAQMSDWPAKLEAIAARTMGADISLVAGIPSWLLILAATLRARTGKGTLKEIWPNLECVIHGGVPLAPFADELRAVMGDGVQFHEVYPASEAFVAAQDSGAGAGLRLLDDAGVFYEFLPLREYDESRLADLGPRALPLEAVQAGEDYVLLLTTPAGLRRYAIGDVVRFVSTEPPRLVYAGRTRLHLSAFGEHVIEKEVTDALALVSRWNRVTVANFHVAPRFANAAAGETRGRHEWWVELKDAENSGLERWRGSATPPYNAAFDTVAFARELDGELQRLNDDYEAKRKGGGLLPPVVRMVAPGTFERWMKRAGKWGGQNKMPRCRSDRVVADELEALGRGM